MSNLQFFKACWNNELSATRNLLAALPTDQLNYRPHPVNRSAYEIVEHILGHMVDLDIILNQPTVDETLELPFADVAEALSRFDELTAKVTKSLETATENDWNEGMVELLISGKSFVQLPRMQMMWFFFFDIIHHRGQLSTYVRPMGGKNPAVYGYSADTV